MKKIVLVLVLVAQTLSIPVQSSSSSGATVLATGLIAIMPSIKTIDPRKISADIYTHKTPGGAGQGAGGGGSRKSSSASSCGGAGSGAGGGLSSNSGGAGGDDGDDRRPGKKGNRSGSYPIGYESSEGRWTEEEDDALREAVELFGAENWKGISEWVAEKVGRARSDVQCFYRWQQVLRPGIRKGLWAEEEEVILAAAVNVYLERGEAPRWTEISKTLGLEGRLGKQCRERWLNHLDPDVVKGPFTEEEDAEFERLRQIHGNRWSRIAREMPGRTENSVKNYFQIYLRRKRASSGDAAAEPRKAANHKRSTPKKSFDGGAGAAPVEEEEAGAAPVEEEVAGAAPVEEEVAGYDSADYRDWWCYEEEPEELTADGGKWYGLGDAVAESRRVAMGADRKWHPVVIDGAAENRLYSAWYVPYEDPDVWNDGGDAGAGDGDDGFT